MRCPWCALEGAPRELHAHLADVHPEGVRFEERAGLFFYAVECPVCREDYERQIKPRSRDPAFLEEHRREIRLVGFDVLINHLMAEHGANEGGARDG